MHHTLASLNGYFPVSIHDRSALLLQVQRMFSLKERAMEGLRGLDGVCGRRQRGSGREAAAVQCRQEPCGRRLMGG